MTKNNIYVDLHVLQTVPPSCVNRDDTGSPKIAVYGGVTRARVSSQSWKRAMRLMFHEQFQAGELGIRTKMIQDLLAERITILAPELKSDVLARKTLEAAGIKIKDDKGSAKTGALFFISRGQVDALAHIAVNHPDGKFEKEDKEELKQALKENPAIDIALFGRMVADDPSLNFDASAQVAHAISTHAVHNEYDYFTAVDDCAPEDNAGAGHLGTVEYNSATLYRYATVNVLELEKNLKADTAKAVRGFAEAFIRSMPTGKQNSFANRTLPDAVYITIRADQPVNMSGAFEKPVSANQGGYMEGSIRAMIQYAQETYHNYAGQPILSLAVGTPMGEIADVMPLDQLLDTLENWICEHSSSSEVSE